MRKDEMTRRRDEIIGLLCEAGEMSASELAARLEVSVQTIRTDLRDLDEAALVQRRNGVVRLRQPSENIGYAPRGSLARAEKQQIAMAVRDLVPDGARVALGTGTTVEACARMLAASREGLFVATNSIHAVLALQGAPGAVVALAGGTVRLRDLDMIGTASSGFFGDYLVDLAVFSCGGLSAAGEVLDYNAEEIAARSAIAGCARKTVLVMDKAKLGRDLPCRKQMIWDYDVVVTGAVLPTESLARCRDAGCAVIQVPTETERDRQ
ncbi:MAG: ArsR family transcriptional regulator [Alphaproteobacteria bacterium MedPE-SWcel]|nr:MAG: ArsR family transcriptional regulator [Alphaproteobacteria bacterium MedPE-SWcel]